MMVTMAMMMFMMMAMAMPMVVASVLLVVDAEEVERGVDGGVKWAARGEAMRAERGAVSGRRFL